MRLDAVGLLAIVPTGAGVASDRAAGIAAEQ